MLTQNHQKKNTLENLWGSYVKNSQQWTKWVFWDYKGKMDQTLSSVLKTASPNVGIEPTNQRLRVSCSIDWASQATPVNHYQHFPSALRSTWIQVMREREGLCRHPCAHQFFWVCRLVCGDFTLYPYNCASAPGSRYTPGLTTTSFMSPVVLASVHNRL